MHCLPRFYRYALRYLGNTADAEDAVQDAALSAYLHWAQFKQEAHITTWLGAIVLNSARMHLRRRLRRNFVSLEHPCGDDERYTLSEQLADARPGPEDRFREAEMIEHLGRFLPRLSPPVLRTFQLRYVDGLSIHETATILEVPEGTVKARLARGRRRLECLIQAGRGRW